MPFRFASHLTTLAILLLIGSGIFLLVKYHGRPVLPAGITSGNGRLEATEIDVATKISGRLSSALVHEGDDVALDQVVAELDAEDIKAELRAAEAQVLLSQKTVEEAEAGAKKSQAELDLATKTFLRSQELIGKGYVSRDKLDQDQSNMDSAIANLAQAQSHLAEAHAAVISAQAKADSLSVVINDTSLKSPISGRVLYRLAEPGEVLPAGGKVITLLDMTDVTLSIYLSAAEAGKVIIGDTARIVLDALPNEPIPARVIFVAPKAQFTPKEVETQNEREKLMFRVKVQITPDWLAKHTSLAKPGMPGVVFVRVKPDVTWPAMLTPR